MEEDLIFNGMVQNYVKWIRHGEHYNYQIVIEVDVDKKDDDEIEVDEDNEDNDDKYGMIYDAIRQRNIDGIMDDEEPTNNFYETTNHNVIKFL